MREKQIIANTICSRFDTFEQVTSRFMCITTDRQQYVRDEFKDQTEQEVTIRIKDGKVIKTSQGSRM